MLLSLGACAAPFGEESADQDPSAPREETVKSAEQERALDALRSRVQEDFVSAPAMRGHEIVLLVDRIEGGPQEITIQAHVMKRGPAGKAIELTDADFVGAHVSESKVASPYRADVTAIMIPTGDGEWSTLKTGILGSRAIEAYVSGQTPSEFEGWAQNFRAGHQHAKRTKL